jgi:hypothetical protein
MFQREQVNFVVPARFAPSARRRRLRGRRARTAWSRRARSFGRPGRLNHSPGSRRDPVEPVQAVFDHGNLCVTHSVGKRAAISAKAEIVKQASLARMDSRTARSAERRCICTSVPHRPMEQGLQQPQIGGPDAAARRARPASAKATLGNSDPSVLRSRPCALVADELRRLPRRQCRT